MTHQFEGSASADTDIFQEITLNIMLLPLVGHI